MTYKTPIKQAVQRFNLAMWRNYTKRAALAADEEYYTLIDLNSLEIETLMAEGFCTKSQIVGVNRDPAVAAEYAAKHGVTTIGLEWKQAILKRPPCPNGGLIYLDSMVELDGCTTSVEGVIASSVMSRRASSLLNYTFGTAATGMIAANFLLTNPHGKTHGDIDTFIGNVDLGDWHHVKLQDGSDYLTYKSRRAQMITFFFTR